jgi:hypothetical protein
MIIRKLLASLLIALPMATFAATPQTAVLDVQNMTCSMCSITIRKVRGNPLSERFERDVLYRSCSDLVENFIARSSFTRRNALVAKILVAEKGQSSHPNQLLKVFFANTDL